MHKKHMSHDMEGEKHSHDHKKHHHKEHKHKGHKSHHSKSSHSDMALKAKIGSN